MLLRTPLHLTSVLICLPAIGWAACPTAADLDSSIRFELASGEWEVFRAHAPDIIEAHFYFDEGGGVRNLLAKGMYLLEVVDFQGGALDAKSRSTYSYPLSPQDMPDPAAGGGWNVKAATLSSDGLDSETQIYTFGTATRQTYGACGYTMIPVTIRYPNDSDTPDIDTIHYLPNLGIGYLAAAKGADFDDVYDYIEISKVN